MTMLIFLLAIFLGVGFLGVPIAISLGVACVTYFFVTDSLSYVVMMAPRIFGGMNSFELIAIPLFIIAGDLLYAGKVSDTLVNLAKAMLGRINGAMAMVTTLACMFFGAVSGSGPATAAAIGSVVAPEMENDGYPNHFTACCISASGPLGVLIPPSIIMVVYGCTTSTSIGSLLLAGVYPGVVYGIILMTYEYYLCSKNNYGANAVKFSWERLGKAFKDSLWALLTPVIILGGIYSGLFTPTEAAGVTIVYAFIVGMFVYKSISFKSLPSLMLKSGVTTATVVLIIGTVSAFSWILTRERIPEQLAEAAIANIATPGMFLFICNIVYILAGMIENGSSAIILIAPLLHPIAMQFGIDPVFFGAMTVANLAIGQLTPPVAATLYISSRICNVPMTKMVRSIIPFFFIMCVGLAIITLTPRAVTFLPNLLLK